MSQGRGASERNRLEAAAAIELAAHAAAGSEAGLPLDEIFRALAEDTDNRSLRVAAERIADELHRGGDMRTALIAVQRELPPYLRRALEASTEARHTAAVLGGLAQHEATRKRIRRQLSTVMFYPAIVVSLLAAIVLGLCILVVPEFERIYADVEKSQPDSDFALPELTKSLIEAARYVPWVFATVGASSAILWLASFFAWGARFIHWLRTGTPFLGRLWIWSGHHELASILGALVAQQVPLDEALDCTALSLRDRNLARSVRIAAEKCSEGEPLAQILGESMHIDPALSALVGWGEAAGSLPEALERAAKTFEEELDLQAAFLQRIMPSVLFIGVVTTMFFFVMGLMFPIVQMIQNLSWPTVTAAPASLQTEIDELVISSVALFTLGICLRISLRLLYGARGPASEDSMHLLMRILAWGLMVLPLVVLSVVGANWLSLVLFVAIFEALGELVLARRQAQRHAVWEVMAGALGSGRSLIDAMRLHQARFSGIVGRAHRRLLRDLEKGVAWQQAVWQNRRAVPREAPAVAALVGASPAAGRAVVDLEERRDPAYRNLERQTTQRFMYLWTVALAMGGVMAYVLVTIAPQYETIFAEFEMTLPSITANMFSATHALVTILTTPVIVATAACGIAALAVGVLYMCDWHVMRWLTDRLTFFRHRAQALRMLAAALDQRTPMDAALQQMANGRTGYPSGPLRSRLARVHHRVVSGEPWAAAMQSSSMVSSDDATVLETAQAAGNLPWAMRLVADRLVRRATFRWSIVQQFVFVAVVVAFGLVVLWFSAAMLIPLSEMIITLAE